MSNKKIKVTIEYTEPRTNEKKSQSLEVDVVIMQGLIYGTEEDKRSKYSTAIVGEASANTLIDMSSMLVTKIFNNIEQRAKSN